MWILFGIGAIIFAVLNLIWTFQSRNKTAEWFRFFSMAFTAACLPFGGQAMRLNKG